jgi:hypothetical protein
MRQKSMVTGSARLGPLNDYTANCKPVRKFQTATFRQEVMSGRKSHKGARYQDIELNWIELNLFTFRRSCTGKHHRIWNKSSHPHLNLKLLYDWRSVSQYVLVSSTLVGLATRHYFLSECCLKFAVWPSYTPGHSLFIASYDSWGYGGSILTRINISFTATQTSILKCTRHCEL